MTDARSPKNSIHFDHQNYQLMAKIGEGGFATVYQAKQRNSGQQVAIKFLTLAEHNQHDQKQQARQNFEREARLTAGLQHPNIVKLLDTGQCRNHHTYAVFEYVSGETLQHHLAYSGALTTTVAVEIMAQVLDALAYAHLQGVIHRDIKPANIMLARTDGKLHAKILDFGIGTCLTTPSSTPKQSNSHNDTLGTPAYSAPEQLRGEPNTTKTDIYAWGLVLLECLTGRPAISGSNLRAIVDQQLHATNVPLPDGLIDTALGHFIRRVVNKNSEQRAGDARQLHKELTQLPITPAVIAPAHNNQHTNKPTDNTTLNQTQIYQQLNL